jgi:flap endonuclease-1
MAVLISQRRSFLFLLDFLNNMGIKGLDKFIRDKFPNSSEIYRRIPVKKFERSRIAIDVFSLLYPYAAVCKNDVVTKTNFRTNAAALPDQHEVDILIMEKFINFVAKICSFGITPVFVLDGPNKANKSEVQEKKKKDKEDNLQKIENLQNKISQLDPLQIESCDIDEYVKLLKKDIILSYELIVDIRTYLRKMGYCVLVATGEGEHLCCQLILDNIVAAVFSNDSDCIAHGCPLLLRGFSNGTSGSNSCFDAVVFSNILKGLPNFSYSMFLDACITSGCDFNNGGIKGIGPVKAFDLIARYKSISEIPEHHPVEKLAVEKCYHEFRKVDSYTELLYEKHFNEASSENEVDPLENISFDFRNSNREAQDSAGSILDKYLPSKYHTKIIASSLNLHFSADKKANNILKEGIILNLNAPNFVLAYEKYAPDEKRNTSNSIDFPTTSMVDPVADMFSAKAPASKKSKAPAIKPYMIVIS